MSFITNALFNIVYTLIGWLPDLSFSIPEGFKSVFFDLFNAVVYFFPIRLLLPIITVSLSYHTFKFFWKVFLRIKSFIPGMGGN